jgi:hypothetical protein
MLGRGQLPKAFAVGDVHRAAGGPGAFEDVARPRAGSPVCNVDRPHRFRALPQTRGHGMKAVEGTGGRHVLEEMRREYAQRRSWQFSATAGASVT